MTNDDDPTELRDVEPSCFRQLIGQSHVKKALQIACKACSSSGSRADDLLMCGPPGLGKTGLVSVFANELGVPMTEILAQSITNSGQLNSMLISATEGILFLDEIHLLHPVQQHALLQVIDKRRISLSSGGGVVSVPVAPFTLAGATTDPDGLIQPLLDRFKMILHLDYYSHDDLAEIVEQRCRGLVWEYQPELLEEIARRGRGTPRIALRLLQSARRYQLSEGAAILTVDHLQKACGVERISDLGLDNIQQKYLALLGNGPVRLNVLASMLGVSTKVLTKTVEPFLLRGPSGQGFIVKDDQGRRQLTTLGREHLSTCRQDKTEEFPRT